MCHTQIIIETIERTSLNLNCYGSGCTSEHNDDQLENQDLKLNDNYLNT